MLQPTNFSYTTVLYIRNISQAQMSIIVLYKRAESSARRCTSRKCECTVQSHSCKGSSAALRSRDGSREIEKDAGLQHAAVGD